MNKFPDITIPKLRNHSSNIRVIDQCLNVINNRNHELFADGSSPTQDFGLLLYRDPGS